MLKKVPGTKDILPEAAKRWQKIEEIAHDIFSLYNYQEMRLPLIEIATLFDRSLGRTSEIVQKQLFLIKQKKHAYALRPEGTACIVRAYLENNLDKTQRFLKAYYLGPMFRAERPQKGRLRQFHHLGCEAIGSAEPGLDVEVISLADSLLKAYSLKGYQIKINSLGCPKDQKKLIQILQQDLKGKVNKLCADCKIRFKGNILRTLDCKKEACRGVIKKLGIQDKHLCPECKSHFMQVKKGLDILNLDYQVIPTLVRGLDYYTRTVFEIIHPDLGAQDALGAGGRYDTLVGDLGGQDTGAIGFALGIERLLLVAPRDHAPLRQRNLVYIISLGEAAKRAGIKILNNLRNSGITTDTDYENKSLKGAMRKANDLGARSVLLIGEDELRKKVVTLKDMVSGEQREVSPEKLGDTLQANR